MKVNIVPLKPEDKQDLESMGIVVTDAGAHFVKKEQPVPYGMMRLSSGKLVFRKPIKECLK